MFVEPDFESQSLPAMPAAEDVFVRLTGRWVLQILTALSHGPMRFTSLRHAIPQVSATVLTARLRELEASHLVVRTVLPSPASCQVYQLGPLAQGLKPALDRIAQWKTRLPKSLEALAEAQASRRGSRAAGD